MKRILLLSFFSVLTVCTSFSQCTPDFIYTSLGLPGVYPPAIQIPNIPIPTGIADGSLGSNYNQTLTLVVLQDTTLDVGFLLPAGAVTAMNAAGISTVMTVDVNHVTFDVQGLPSGINSQCDISNCQYPSSIDGCIKLNGTPTVAGTFSVDVNMTINIQIPAITDPIFGTVIFPATSLDIPSFAAQTYDLFISDATAMKNIDHLSQIYPNPSNSNFTIEVNSPTNLMIYNNLGQLVYSKKIINNINIDKSELGSGIFIVEISDNNFVEKNKIILN
jgi:hypothetical protein